MSDGISWYKENIAPYLRQINGYGFLENGKIVKVSTKTDEDYTKPSKSAFPVNNNYRNNNGLTTAYCCYKTEADAKKAAKHYLSNQIKELKEKIKELSKVKMKLKI